MKIITNNTGCGREKFVERMLKQEQMWHRVSGTDEEVKQKLEEHMLKPRTKMIIDQPNLTLDERSKWYDLGKEYGMKIIEIVCVDLSSGKNKSDPDQQIEKPQAREGFTKVYLVQKELDFEKVLKSL